MYLSFLLIIIINNRFEMKGENVSSKAQEEPKEVPREQYASDFLISNLQEPQKDYVVKHLYPCLQETIKLVPSPSLYLKVPH